MFYYVIISHILNIFSRVELVINQDVRAVFLVLKMAIIY